MKKLLPLCLLLLCVTPSAHAWDYDDPDGIPDVGDLERLPIPEYRWALIRFEHEVRFARLEELGERWRDLREHLREKPRDAWAKAQIEDVGTEVHALAQQLFKLFEPHGATVGHWRWARAGREPLPDARHAHGWVARHLSHAAKEAGPDDSRTALKTRFDVLIACVDRAQGVLATALPESADGEKDEFAAARHRLEERSEQIERRFWRVVDWLVPAETKARMRGALPMAYQGWDDPLAHARLLPGLSAGAINRIRALEAEIEAQSAPDEALLEPSERIAEDESKPEAERKRAEQAIRGAEKRLAQQQVDLFERLEKVLGPEHWRALRAIPPRVDPGVRMEDPGDVMGQLDEILSGGFAPPMVLVQRYRKLREATEQEMEKLENDRRTMGADSPQMEMMELKEAALEARMSEHSRQVLSEIFLQLHPSTVVAWVLSVK